MKKTVLTALAVSAGVALQVQAQVAWPDTYPITDQPNVSGSVGGLSSPVPTTKLGFLTISLNNQFQAYSAGGKWGIQVKPNDPRLLNGTVNWDNISYTYPDWVDCNGTIMYKSAKRTINKTVIIGAINKALSWPAGRDLYGGKDDTVMGGPLSAVGSPYLGAFTSKAMLVVVNYDNGRALPPYPPTEDYVGDEGTGVGTFDTAVWNAPFNLNFAPDVTLPDGEILPMTWPNQNYISWGKIWDTGEGFDEWIGARVFIVDPKNINSNLRCFDVTPFFALEESYCYYCWDTMDRVTDGTITYTQNNPANAPCATPGAGVCGVKGSGTTKLYWTVKFNNVMGGWIDDANAPNYVLSYGFQQGSLYYDDIVGFQGYYGDTYGWKLDDTDEPGSVYALSFTVSGVATYPWKFKKLSDGYTWPMGTYRMSAAGHGFSPMCGVFNGTVSITEYDQSDKLFGGAWCLTP